MPAASGPLPLPPPDEDSFRCEIDRDRDSACIHIIGELA
jgi:hypothetical protein